MEQKTAIFKKMFMHSFLSTGTWGYDLHWRKDEGHPCVCMCTCVVIAQWEVDDECF